MYGSTPPPGDFCPPGRKKVALVERWPLAEFRLYLFVGVWTSNETLLLGFELHLFVLSSNWLMDRTVASG